MITIYEITPNKMLGHAKQIDPQEGIPRGWTYDAPSNTHQPHMWNNNSWLPISEEQMQVIQSATSTAGSQVEEILYRSLTPVQFRQALRQMDLLHLVKDWVNSQSDHVQDLWEYALEFHHEDEFITLMLTENIITLTNIQNIFQQ